MVISRLLDRDVPADERALAESLVASCTACAALQADLLALAAATRAQPAPAMPRSFTFSAEDAARLAGQAAGEPGSTSPRLSGVMTDPFATSDHASHDTILVASLADHSLPASERAAAEALVATCSQCADLGADLLALRAATMAMPTLARPNDYTLTARDAVRLRSGGWRRFVAILGTSRDALSRPLAVGLTTLGLAGLLASAAPSLMMGGATSASAPTTISAPAGGATSENGDGSGRLGPVPAASAAAAAAPSAAPPEGGIYGSAVDPSAAPLPARAPLANGATKPSDTTAITNGTAGGRAATSGDKSREPGTSDDLLYGQDLGGVSPLVVLSIAFLIGGLGLFAMRWTARRFGG